MVSYHFIKTQLVYYSLEQVDCTIIIRYHLLMIELKFQVQFLCLDSAKDGYDLYDLSLKLDSYNLFLLISLAFIRS